MEQPRAMIVVGASAGGVDAIRTLVSALPADLDAALFIVLHIGTHHSELPVLIDHWGPLRASHPANGQKISRGHIYVAPPDHHMLLEHGAIQLTRGPRENWARPAVDPLFRSAAQIYGAQVIGIILTGGLNDGTAGLFEIAQRGGTTIVQDPGDAADPGMPRSALLHVAVDHCLPVAAMPALLERLTSGRPVVPERTPSNDLSGAIEPGSSDMTDYTLDEPVAVTCPDCGGALRRTALGTLGQFRCHIGHVYTEEVMIQAQFAALEWSMAAALRALGERRELCRQMADKSWKAGNTGLAAQWNGALDQATGRADSLKHLLEKNWTHPSDPLPQARSMG